MKSKQRRDKPVHVPLPFDEAIRRALKVPPPPEGWGSLGKKKGAKKRKAG